MKRVRRVEPRLILAVVLAAALVSCGEDQPEAPDLSAALLTQGDVAGRLVDVTEPLPDNSPCFGGDRATDRTVASFQGRPLEEGAVTQVVMAFDSADVAAEELDEAADRILRCTYNSLRSPVSLLEFPDLGDQTKALVVTPAPDATFTPISWVYVRRDNLVTVVTATGFSEPDYEELVRLADERLASLVGG